MTKTCICEVGWSGPACGTVGETSIGGSLVFDPPFTTFTYGALRQIALSSILDVVMRVRDTLGGVPSGRRMVATLAIQDGHEGTSLDTAPNSITGRRMAGFSLEEKLYISDIQPDKVDYVIENPPQDILDAAKLVRPPYFGLTLLGELCVSNGIAITTSEITHVAKSTPPPSGGVHLVLVVADVLATVDVSKIREILGWENVRLQDVSNSTTIVYKTVDPQSGAVRESVSSEGPSDPDVIRSWLGDNTVTGKGGGTAPPKVEEETSPILGIIIGVCVAAVGMVGVCGYLYVHKRGPFNDGSHTKSVGPVIIGRNSMTDPECPPTAGQFFSRRTAPSEDDEELRRNSHEMGERSFRRKSADYAGERQSAPIFRRKSAGDGYRPGSGAEEAYRNDINFKTNVHAEYQKKHGQNDKGGGSKPSKESNPTAEDDADRGDTREDESGCDGESNANERKSYRTQRPKAAREEHAEPEAEPQGPGPTGHGPQGPQGPKYNKFNFRRLTKPPIVTNTAHLPDISTRESLEFLDPKLAGDTSAAVSKKIGDWMSQYRTYNFEARKKAMRHLSLMWHPDKNADNLEMAKEVFQFLQNKKDWFLKP